MNELSILAVFAVITMIIIPILLGNSQHMIDKAESKEEREEWEAEKADVGNLGCKMLMVMALLAGVFILIISKG